MSDVPPEIPENAVQLLRAWADEGSLIIELDLVWEDPSNWGLFLADVTRHIAMTHAEENGAEPQQVLDSIVNALQDELENPSEEAPQPDTIN